MDELLTSRLFPSGPVTVIPSLFFWRSIDAAWMPDEDVRVAVPDNLIRLFKYAAEGSGTHLEFLSFVFNQKWFRADQHQENWMTFSRERMLMIESLEMAGRLIRITEKDIDPSVASAFRDAFDKRYEIELSPRRNFMREYFTRALSFSKTSGAKIIDKSGNFFRAAGRYMTTLQIPDRIDHITVRKQMLSRRIFGFRGGKGTKFFIGVVISAAGIYLQPVSVVGLVIAFTDP